MKLKDILLMDCETATGLSDKLNDKKLSFGEKLGLRIHLLICDLCGLFFKQSKIIDDSAKVYAEKITLEKKSYPLDPQRKAQLSEAFKAEMKNQEV
jgi:hypothetical protein